MAEKYPNQTPDQTKEPNGDQTQLAAKDDLLDTDQLQRLTLEQVEQDSNLQIAQNAAAAHPGVTTIQQNITIESQYNVRGGQTIVTGDQTNTIGDRGHISTSAGTSQRDATQSFDLKKCQEELREFYLSEKGKVNLLPWVPDAVEDMDNIFVDLELVKQKSFRSSEEVKGLESNEDLVSLKTGQGQRVNRVLVMGDAGSGKSTMAANIAFKWASLTGDTQSPLSKFKLVFLISLHEIPKDSNGSLVDLIFQLILPEDSEVSKEGLKSYITSNAKDVLLLIDGMDENSSILKASSKEITKILHNRKLRSCCVILTTRQHRISDLGEHLRHYTQVKLTGFSLENIMMYIKMFFREDTDKYDTLIQKLKQEPHILALAAIPALLLMICLLWEDQCSLPHTKTQLYKNTLNHMWKRYKSKESPVDEESYGEEMIAEMQSLLYALGKVALNGIEDECEQIVFTEKDFGSEVFNLGCQVGIINRERLRSKCGVKELVTFLHKSFQDFCEGMYLAKLLDSNQSEFEKFLKKLYQIKDYGSEIHFFSSDVLDFCCGIQPSMLEILLKLTLRVFGQGAIFDISMHLRYIFESQLTYVELVSLFSCVDNLKLSVSYRDAPYLLYLLKLSESENSHEGFILAKLANFHIIMGYEQWLPSLFKFTPNLVTLDIKLGNRFKSISPSHLKELYLAISKLGEMKDLKLQNLNVFIQLDITYLLDILTKNKKIDLKKLFLEGFQFDNKVMTAFLINCSSLAQLSLNRLQPGLSIKDVIKAIPTLRKLESLNIGGYKIGGTVKYLKSVVPQLLKLSFPGGNFNNQNLKELFTFLNRAQKLKVLDLGGTTFSLASVKSLVECLQQIPSLKELSLTRTGLNDETVCVLAEGLKEMKSPLRKLYLYGNSYSQIGKAALAGLPVEDDIEDMNEARSQFLRDIL